MPFYKRFLLQIGVGVLGLYTASYLLEQVSYTDVSSLFAGGAFLGFVNFFIRPVLKLLTLPIRLLTLGLFTFFINTAIVWFVQLMLEGVVVENTISLLLATGIIWCLEFTTHIFLKK